jgi:tetratricopeptide (TPR) repeat protein
MNNPGAKTGRNESCPCGSGRKYKRCCGLKKAAPQAPRQARQTPTDARSAVLGSAEIIELMSLSQAGRHGELERRAREQTQRHPRAGMAWKALTVALRMQGKDSLSAAQRAAELSPEDAEAQNHLGMALMDAGRAIEAAARFQQVLRIKPDDLGACMRLGNLLADLGRLEEAAACYQRATQIHPGMVETRYRLGTVLMALGRHAPAIASFEQAIAQQPGSAELHAQLGTALRMLGRIEAAEAQFRRALELNPDLAEAWAGIAQLRCMTPADTEWLAQAQRVLDAAPAARSAIPLNYAIGKYFDDTGDFERAFEAFRRANELAGQQGRRFDPVQLSQEVDRFIEVFDRRWLAEVRNRPQSTARPVFIVGMPRSGCSLLGTLLSAHPALSGAGELRFWSDAANYYDAAIRRGEAAVALIARLAAEYERLIQALAPDAQRAIDHMPGNFVRLGMIHAALPEARIIHMRRDPIDTCLSIYSQDSDGVLSFASELDDLAHYYRQYRRLMQHWHSLLPAEAILDIDCEALIAAQEPCCRAVLEFLGLPWDERCLESHRAEPLPPYVRIGPAGHWRHYARHLGPLLALAEP